jgi:hypothetical protein
MYESQLQLGSFSRKDKYVLSNRVRIFTVPIVPSFLDEILKKKRADISQSVNLQTFWAPIRLHRGLVFPPL